MKSKFVNATRCILFLFGLGTLSIGCNTSPKVMVKARMTDPTKGFDVSFAQYLKDLQKTQLSVTQNPGASIYVVKDTAVYLRHLYGIRDLETGAPVTDSTLFRMGSLSKGFTGILVAKLHEKGILDLNTPVVDYLPCLSKGENEEVKKINLTHLLSHSSGITPHAYTLDLESGVLPIDLCERYERLINSSRREVHFYQNAFFALIEVIIANETGKPFAEVLREELFEPLGMNSVALDHESYLESGNYAAPHRWNRRKKRYEKVPFKRKYYNAVSAGGISMSSADLCKWMKALLGHRKDVISEQVLQLAFHKHIDTRNDPRNVNRWPGVDSVHYGLGWRLVDYQGKNLMYHAGYVDEFRSEILIDPKDKVGIFAVFNSATSYASKVVPSILQGLTLREKIDNRAQKSVSP